MFDRARENARQKLQRALTEVIGESDRRTHELLEAQHQQVLSEVAELRGQLADTRARIDHLEQQERRDLTHVMDVEAARTSGDFVLEHMPKAPLFWSPQDTLRFALSKVSTPGLALEFGVATGSTLRIVVGELKGEHGVYGFDVFSGLPQTWRTGFPAGEFAQDTLPDVPGAELIAGLFEDTLPGFLAERPEPVAFLHLDADLYSSTITVLDLIEHRLVPGTIIVFDEFFNFPGWQQHEYRAWQEFVSRTGIRFEYLAYTADHEQVVARVIAA
ncbi:TylF/MycF/NovP-related O-methyltransferase [Rhodococcus sp. NPDC058521]|uniref:TylF/MycF/NovP-related O-methyltransferase n=1 Tax=Rhodococcus sp. NPDC058521 TaxID=3346536 RepID=UPI003657E97D